MIGLPFAHDSPMHNTFTGVLVTQDIQNHLYGITRRRTTCGILYA